MATSPLQNDEPDPLEVTTAPDTTPEIPYYKTPGFEARRRDTAFYINNYRRLTWICLFLSVTILGLSLYILYKHMNLREERYYTTSVSGEVKPLSPIKYKERP